MFTGSSIIFNVPGFGERKFVPKSEIHRSCRQVLNITCVSIHGIWLSTVLLNLKVNEVHDVGPNRGPEHGWQGHIGTGRLSLLTVHRNQRPGGTCRLKKPEMSLQIAIC